MTADEKRRHAQDLTRRLRAALGMAMSDLRADGRTAGAAYHWADEADRLADHIEHTLHTMQPHQQGGGVE